MTEVTFLVDLVNRVFRDYESFDASLFVNAFLPEGKEVLRCRLSILVRSVAYHFDTPQVWEIVRHSGTLTFFFLP